MTLGEDGEFNDIIYEQGIGNFVKLIRSTGAEWEAPDYGIYATCRAT
jgi:hypothetical protein